MLLALLALLVLALVALIVTVATARRSTPAGRPAFYETPVHLYGNALVADDAGGDDPNAGGAEPEFVLPDAEAIALLSAEFDDDGLLVGGELHALETQAVEAFDALRAGDLDADAIALLSTLADAVDTIRSHATERVTAAAEAAANAEALANRVHPTASAGDGEGEGGDEGGDGGDEGAGDGAPAEGAAAEPEPEPVLASGRGRGTVRVPLGRIRQNAPAPQATVSPYPQGVTITAAADVRGIAGGAEVPDTLRLAGMMHDRTRALGRGDGASALVASIHTEYDHTVAEDATKETMRDAMEAARDPESLVAAGGWCAPSDRLWEFFSIEATGGLLDLPTVGVDRGGLEWPVSPSIGDVFDVPWLWTEADDIAALGNPHADPDDDREKPCFRIPCGTWDEVRLRAHGVCVTHGNLSNEAWPEQTRRYLDLVMAAHAHVMAGRNLARMVALSTPVTIGTTAGALAPLLNAIELQVSDYRDKFRMGESVLLEAVFDSWVPALIRADLARRENIDALDVPNSRIAGWFQDRGVRPQFVHNFHPLQTGGGGDGFRETWPTTVTFLLYAAGTFVRGTGPTIDLGVVRDSKLNATNDYTAAWTEESDLVAKLGHESRLVSVVVCPNGSYAPPHAALTCPIA